MKKRFLTTIVIAFTLTLVMMPGASLANITVTGDASMTWDVNAFPAVTSWVPDSQGSFSSTAVNLNGVYESYDAAYIEGAWGGTSFSKTLTDGTGSVTGSASTLQTGFPMQTASSNISLLSPGNAGVNIAQALLLGQFTVDTATTLNIFADYSLAMTLFNNVTNSLNSYVDVSVGLALSNFDTGALFTSDSRFFSMYRTGLVTPTDSFSDTGQLHLAYNLVPGVVYDFEAQASTKSSVPEPMSLILLASGMAGLAIFRKRFA